MKSKIVTKKRKLNNKEANQPKEPDKKKRKFNEKNNVNINNKPNVESNKTLKTENYALKQYNNQLIKKNDHFEEKMNIYKKEANQWKYKYMKLQSQIRKMSNDKTTTPNHNNININSPHTNNSAHDIDCGIEMATNKKIQHNNYNKKHNISYDSIRDRLLEMGFDKNNIINMISLYNGSGEDPQFVYNQCIHTFAPQNTKTESDNETDTETDTDNEQSTDDSDSDTEESDNESESESNESNQSMQNNYNLNYEKKEFDFHVSVHCHVCKKHFDDFVAYEAHLQKHYADEPTKTWKICDMGCKINPKKPLFCSNDNFVSHISQHTNDKPFKCDAIIHGHKCRGTAATMCRLKLHWISHRNNNRNKNNKQFENSYYVSADCHMCKQHFDNIYEYRDHLQYHYANDPNKQWKKCDMGCKINPKRPLFYNSTDFMSHIQSHTKKYVFHCRVKINGIRCAHSMASKSSAKKHWTCHVDTKHKKKKNAVRFKSMGPRERIRVSEKNSEYIAFDKCFRISVACHICKKHFENLDKYKRHLQNHYENDKHKKWRKCDLGCDIKCANDTAFISHISQHTNDKPFKCVVKINGFKCKSSFGHRNTLKGHWKLHFKNKNKGKGKGKGNVMVAVKKKIKKLKSSNSKIIHIATATNNKRTRHKKHRIRRSNINSEYVSFEDSYSVSINCHICGKHFDNFETYKEHIKRHYNNERGKQWGRCDFGCKIHRKKALVFEVSALFIGHILKHTDVKPFKCNVLINGVKCDGCTRTKGNFKGHWRRHFPMQSKKYFKKYKTKCKTKDSDNSNSDTGSESDSQSSTSCSSSSQSESASESQSQSDSDTESAQSSE